MITAHEIARAMGGTAYGNRAMVPGPGHSRADRSLSVKVVPDAPGGFVVHSHAGDDPLECKDHIRQQCGLPSFGEDSQFCRRRQDHAPAPEPDQRALALWREAVPIAGTPAEKYLRKRGIDIPLPPTLRFLPGMMIAAVSSPDRTIIAIQRTFLDDDGNKAGIDPPRMSLGAMGSGAIRLAPAGEILGLTESTEDALSVIQLFDVPTWAVMGTARLGKITIPASVKHIHIFADTDPAGDLAARSAADTYSRSGKAVKIRRPVNPHKDFNDVLLERRASHG